jgi:hypothetical protein
MSRPPKLTAAQLAEARPRREQGATLSEFARCYNVVGDIPSDPRDVPCNTVIGFIRPSQTAKPPLFFLDYQSSPSMSPMLADLPVYSEAILVDGDGLRSE